MNVPCYVRFIQETEIILVACIRKLKYHYNCDWVLLCLFAFYFSMAYLSYEEDCLSQGTENAIHSGADKANLIKLNIANSHI